MILGRWSFGFGNFFFFALNSSYVQPVFKYEKLFVRDALFFF